MQEVADRLSLNPHRAGAKGGGRRGWRYDSEAFVSLSGSSPGCWGIMPCYQTSHCHPSYPAILVFRCGAGAEPSELGRRPGKWKWPEGEANALHFFDASCVQSRQLGGHFLFFFFILPILSMNLRQFLTMNFTNFRSKINLCWWGRVHTKWNF